MRVSAFRYCTTKAQMLAPLNQLLYVLVQKTKLKNTFGIRTKIFFNEKLLYINYVLVALYIQFQFFYFSLILV